MWELESHMDEYSGLVHFDNFDVTDFSIDLCHIGSVMETSQSKVRHDTNMLNALSILHYF